MAKRKRVRQLAEKIEAGVVIESRVEPKHAHPRAIVQCGVLKDFLLHQLHDFDVHLDGVARMLLLEQLHLPRAPTRRLRQDWHTNVAEHALNRSRVDPQRVDALKPHAGAGRTPTMLGSRHANEIDRRGRQPALALPWVLRNESRFALGFPSPQPGADRPSREPEMPARGLDPMLASKRHDRQPLLHPQPELCRNRTLGHRRLLQPERRMDPAAAMENEEHVFHSCLDGAESAPPTGSTRFACC